MEIVKEFTFDAAHYLPNVPDTHKCKNLHGHTYRVRLFLEGPLDPLLGWVMDFAEIKSAWKPLEQQLDHQTLNNIPGMVNTTAEELAVWIYDQLKPQLPLLSRIELNETASNWVIYRGV
ncbi:MAG: 6-carboxytetrahydropterin synthase QueD [Saprospirales bacterium]|jgi:6-pyruvoyltetrahydropterin/6-carboxytetrahydropterin synthase|nr:6-carboxytetrahydropterin synthase QueD [Saprospirales bacterium]MBK6901723.1 6-carboxytetrahydropterin synthase QueD [Saprospirales bacterium]MBK7335393.1 6-carboxytetrahydropterin synthase QueD [Saprospirales bacterium]